MKKIKEYKGIIIIILVLILVAFYWFQIRPLIIKNNCYFSANRSTYRTGYKDGSSSFQDTYNFYFKRCLQSKGL